MSPFSTAHGMGGYCERVEGFVPRPSGSKLIREINEMEENFRHFGAAVIKFWVQIDQEEQLRRFQAREKNPRKSGVKSGGRRNREKWQPYEEAVNEMFLRTHAPKAPWTIIEGNCKRYARIKALDVVIEAIEKRSRKKETKFFPSDSYPGRTNRILTSYLPLFL